MLLDFFTGATSGVDHTDAWIGLGAVVTAAAIGGIPALLATLKANRKIGKPNGSGNLVQMLEKALEGQGELKATIDHHNDQDEIRFKAVHDRLDRMDRRMDTQDGRMDRQIGPESSV